ncbi:MAG: hypothetical protein IPK83_20120 [Planctomycetes bacterium]|nr:hypothetical protein [Planctomycetota bacterium]
MPTPGDSAESDDVSAGMALGLSFIPLFNVPWTAFLMLRLANFSAAGERKSNDAAVSAIHAAKLCLITSIVMVGTCCASYSLVFASAYPIFNEAMQNNIDPKSPEFQTKMQEAANAYPMLSFATMLIVMVGAIVYAFAVRKLEASLYDRLGALPK